MKKKDVKEIIRNGESKTVEFKERVSSSVGKSICAFTNTGGGTILLGVSKQGDIKGCSEEEEQKIVNIAHSCTPSIYLDVEKINFKKKAIFVVKVAEGDKRIPYAYSNRVYRREGTSDNPVPPSQILDEARDSGVIKFDEQICEEAGLEDLSEERVEWYLNNRERIRHVSKPEELSQEELLVNLKAVKRKNGELKPTNAGILFLGKHPQKFLPHSTLWLRKIKGIKLTNMVIDSLDSSGTLWQMLDQAETFLKKNIRYQSEVTDKSFQREDKLEYPLEALREGIVNALIHRNYFVSGRK